ncbi:cytidine deaminase [Emergomyces africanus]|uniref:Cytidine deaminase n=1 Tax=Emergomyces africanus TaxID=1955775 RepID=A0A1B7NL37_9EURO|nr:cytidine deaminase [Emergomyces africanus]
MSAQISATQLQTLSSKAIAAKEAAHCPYSKFRVGACLLTEEGEFIVGANVENVSYPVGVCAERCAFSTAVVAGHKNFKAIAVSTDIVPGASPFFQILLVLMTFRGNSRSEYLIDESW